MKKKCRHEVIEVIHSPDDGGFYGECRSGCFATGPLASSRCVAMAEFIKAAREGRLTN